jgi:hypothetical protein
MDFRFPAAFLLLLHQGMGRGQHLEAIFRVTLVGRDFRQNSVKPWDAQHCSGGLPGGNPLADLGYPLLTPALHG